MTAKLAPMTDDREPTAPRRMSLVRFRYDLLPKKFHRKYPSVEGRASIYSGEIPNMPGHCVMMDHRTGHFHSGYHVENFAEIPKTKPDGARLSDRYDAYPSPPDAPADEVAPCPIPGGPPARAPRTTPDDSHHGPPILL